MSLSTSGQQGWFFGLGVYWEPRVADCCDNDETRASNKVECWLEVEEHHRDSGCKDNGDSRGESLKNVIGVFDDDCYQQSSERLDDDYKPYKRVVAIEKAIIHDGLALREEDRCKAKQDTICRKLDVANPDIFGGVLENHFKIDAPESGHE